MDEAMKAAAEKFNADQTKGAGWFAIFTDGRLIGEYRGFVVGEFDTVESFEAWAYEGGDTV